MHETYAPALLMLFSGFGIGLGVASEIGNQIKQQPIQAISITYEDRNNDGLADKVEQFDFGELIKYAKKDSIGEIKYELRYGLVELK